MTIVLTVFAHSPDEGQGYARDMRVRWSLEEAGIAYAVRPVGWTEMKGEGHRRLQPFGQIPTYEEQGVTLFESGAIVLHIAERHRGLLPRDPAARARAISWLFAALNTVEPPIVEWEQAGYLEADRSWLGERLSLVEARIAVRLAELESALGGKDWLDGSFSAADLMMVTVLRRLEGSSLLTARPTLAAYVARGEARPAYARAFAAQKALFEARAARG